MFKVGDKVRRKEEYQSDRWERNVKNIYSKETCDTFTVTSCNGIILMLDNKDIIFNAKYFELINDLRVKYMVVDNHNTIIDAFETEQQAFDYINNQSVTIGDIYTHRDGLVMEVVNVADGEVEVSLEVCGSVFYSKYAIETLLKEFTKCKKC